MNTSFTAGRSREIRAAAVELIDEKKLRLGRDRLCHVDRRVPIEQRVEPGGAGARRSANQKIRKTQQALWTGIQGTGRRHTADGHAPRRGCATDIRRGRQSW